MKKYKENFCQDCEEVEHNIEKQFCGYCGKLMTVSEFDNKVTQNS